MPKYKPLYSLYKGLRESKYDVPDSYVSFQKTLTQAGDAGAKSRRGLYQSLKDSNYDVPDTYEDFYKNLFVPVNSTTSRALKIGENPNTPTVNRYRQKMFDSVDPNKNGLNNLSNQAVGQAVRATNNVRKPVTAKVLNRKGKPTGNEFAITPAKTVEDLDREYAQETTKNWENELHDQMADADRDAAKISDMFKSFIGSTDEVGSVWGNMTRGGGIAGTPHSVTTNNGIMENTEARQILAAGDYNRKRRELLQLEQDSRNGAIFDDHSFWRGMYDAAKDTGFLTGGASDLINAGSLLATKQDLDNGVHTEAGDMLMQQAVKNSDAQSQYGDNQGWMYTGGVITTNMAPFMMQVASAGFSKGMSNAIGKVVQGAASKVALGTMEKATGMAGAHIANYIGKVTGLTTKAFGKAIQYGIVGAAQANTVGLGNVANDVINRYTGQVYQDEQGNYKFGTFDSDGKLVHEGGEDFLTALVKGEAAQTIEFATELAGGGIDAAGTALKNFVTKGGKKIINKYNMENVSKVIDFLLNNKVSKNARYLKAGADRTLGKVELNSIVGESLEEELGIIANTVFTGDNKISDLWDEKQQSQIWGGMLLSIGLMKGAVAPFHAYNAKQYYSYKHKLDKADVNLSQLLGKEKWEELRNQIDATTNEDMPEMANKINRDVALGKNRQPVREYIQNLLIMRGYDIGNMLAAKKAVEDKGEGVSVKNMEKNQAYQQGRDAYGYDTHEIQLDQEDKQKSLAQLLGISEQQLASMSDEELETLSGRDDNIDRAIYDYQLSTARYEGVIDNARDQIDLEVQRAAQAVDMYTDKSRNTIRNATIKVTGGLEDYGVYIINGNIATHEDGSIDISNSDDMILYYDPTTNTVEHADAMMFAELGSEENADEVRSQAMADAKEKAIKETTGIIDGVVEVGTQFKTVDADGTEHTYEVLADNGDGTAVVTIDGNVPTELVKGENVQVPVSFEELQKIKDASDQQRLQAAKAQREQMEKERAEQQMQAQTTQAENPSQEDNIQPAPIEDNLDYSDIIREDGKVQMVDVSDKDGNNLFPDAKDVFYIQGNKMRTKFAYIDANGELKTQSFPTGLVKIKTRGEVSVDDYKKYRSTILSAESYAMPESSMIEDNSGSIEADRGGIEVEDNTQPLSEADADKVIAQMESSAETAPDLELTPDNWTAEFGEDGILSTPIGDVKMGENQVAKLFEKGRSKEFGMIKPTLTNPDVIIEVPSHSAAGNEERSSSYLFIKTFLGKNGEKVYYFKSVTIKKDGLEISISSHYDRVKRVKEALMKGKLLYRKNDGAQTEQNQPSTSVTTSQEDAAGSSESKDTNISSNGNENNESLTFEDGTPIPVDVNGEVDLSQSDAAHAAEWYDNNLGEDADDWLDGEIKKAKKVLEQAKNKKLAGTKPSELVASKKEKEAAIADAQAHYDSAISIRDSLKERRIAKVEDTAEGRKELIEKARRKFARLKSAVKDDAEAVSQLYRDTIGSLLHRLYDSTGIDVTDTTPLTAEEYVASNLGAHSLNYEGTETSKGVKQETGLSREDFAKTQLLAADGKGTTIDALVHSLWENRPSNLESLDTQDIRNALIGVLNSGFKASEARNFVENIRIAQAENILEEQKRAQEDAAYAEQHKAEPEAELKAKSDEKAESKAKSEAKLDNESDNESNDLSNESDNEKINDNINDNINVPEVPEDATDENPLGLQLSEDKVPFEIEGGKSGETYDINDNEDRQRLINGNKVDDKDILDIDMPKHVHKAIKELCKKMGLKVQFLYMGARSNGWIENGTMYLALDTEKATQFVFGHEMTHAIKQKNPEAYKELVKVAMAVTTKKKFEEDLAKVYQNYHGISGYNNVDDYVEEVVADNLGKFINDFDLAQKFSLRLNHPILGTILHAIQKIKSLLYGDFYKSVDALERIVEKAYVETANGQVTNSETGEDISFSLRQKPEPKKKGIGYKVFVLKDGKLYPPMVANPNGAATPVGVWLDADAAPIAGESKTGRPQVKQGGKGTQGGSGKLAYRPGWHLGVVPYAIQFNRKDAEGNKTLFPKNFVFAEVEYAADVDYQEEARQEGINPSGKYQHSLAGLKHLPTDGYYMYRTNPNPETDPWVITGAMKVNRILTRAEQADLVSKAGREPQQIQEGDIVTDDVVNSINQEIAAAPKFSLKVYHGSGADFTEFDFDHMGEGAGSQVFGWGGYVTSSKKIGKSYANLVDANAPHQDVEYFGNNAHEYTDVVAGLFNGGQRDYDDVKEFLQNGYNSDKENARKKQMLEWFESTKPSDWKSVNDGKRNLYEVDIPEDNGSNYLEWEKKPSDEVATKIIEGLYGLDAKTLDDMASKDIVFRTLLYDYIKNADKGQMIPLLVKTHALTRGTTYDNGNVEDDIRFVYNRLSRWMGSQKAASQFLSSIGFTGIKYPAGTIMGGAEENDTNYVIFKSEDMRITEHTKFSIKTYHGSQASFDKFDHSFMGSGEGAQAYGWGTYVSEVEGIAKAYAKQNAAKHGMPREYKIAQTRLNHAKFEYDKVQRRYDNSKAYIDSLKEDLQNYRESIARRKEKVEYFAQNNMPETVDKLLKQIKRTEDTIKVTENDINMRTNDLEGWKPKLEEVKKKYEEEQNKFDAIPKPQIERNLYSVDIPDDTGENYIGWDEKMTPRMRDIRKEILEDNGYKLVDSDEVRDYFEDRDGKEYELFKEQYKTGGTFYEELAQLLHSQKLASLALKEYGFDGVKVIAQRNTVGNKEGKMNYVIFDENNANITSHTKFSLKSKPVRFEAGKKLSDEEKKEVLSTLKDAYKVNGVPYHIEETAGGKEKRVYEPTADSYVVSDITNRPLRYYITLPDGRVAHPTEVYPNISDNEVKSSATKQGLLDEEVDQIVSAAIGNMKDIADNAKAIEVLTELQNLPHETHDVGYGMNNAQSYNYKTGIFTSDAAQAIDYVVRRMRRKEDVPTEIPAALKKAVADSYGMVDNLIGGMSTTKFSLKKVNDDFNQRLEELVKNPNQKDKILRLGRSSSFLKVGGITDAEIELDFDKFIRKSGDKYKNNHPFSASDLINLPMALAEPIAVFNSTTANDHVVLTELQKDGKNFIVAVRAVEQHRKGGVVLEVNKITSLYPKEERGIVYWINNGRISNVDKEKALHFIEALQPHAGTTITDEELKSAANIINSFETTKGNGKKVDVEEPKTFEEFLNHPSLKFSIKNEEQRKAAEDAYEYASKLRPNKYAQYALVDMSNPSNSPQYYEKRVLADRWRRFYNKEVHNELDDVYKDAWGNYKLFDLDRPFADQVNEVKGDVPNEFNAPDVVANKNADNESGAEYHEYKQDEPSSITYKDRYKAFKQREANREKTAGLRKERNEVEDVYKSKSEERVEYNKQLMKEYMDEHGLSSENDIPYDVWDNLRSKSFEKYQDELDSLFNKYKNLDKQIKAVAEPRFSLKDEKIKSVAEKFGVNEYDVAMYANAVEKGSTAEAARARANIKRYLLQANEDKISSFKELMKYTVPVNEALKENFGDLDAMIEERRKQVEAERNAMEAARKRAQEEEEKRQKHLDELSLIPTDELDKRYMDAIANNDESTAREMLDESARRNGYGDVDSDYQGQGAWAAPSNPQYESDEARRADIENSPDVNLEDIALGYSLQPDDYFDNPRAYMNNTAYGLESAHVIKNALDAIKNGEKDVKVKVYRAVPTSVKEGKLRNGDWVTPSKKYAEMHGDNRLEGKYRIIEDEVPANQLWWDGNDANEFGFDDGKEYRYKNAKNNRKLNDLITYDNKGNVIPPSKRFNSRKNDIRFSLAGERGAADMAEDLKSLDTPDEVDDAIKTAIDDMPSGWQMANKKMIHIAQALGENRKAEIAGEEPKFSLKDGTLIKAGTYFSGGGLVEEGLKGIIDPVVAVEYDEKISGVYRNNFGQHIVTADVRDVDPKELVKQIDGEVEYFHASPVCKNYSQAKSNHAEVELDKETAASTAEFINAVKPKVVTIENVKGYKNSEAMKIITDALDANGYTWDADVYNAADYGGYTNRERLIVRAVRDGKLPEKPKKMAHKSGWYEAVADIIPTLTEKKNGVAPWMDIRLKADGIDWRNIDKPLYVMGSAYADGKVPHAFADELLPTLRTKSGDVIVMPDGKVYRALGRVLARVSGVSDDYKMPFSENLSHTIIGNGIPTQLTEHVIAPLLQNTLHPTTPEDGNTKFSLRGSTPYGKQMEEWMEKNHLEKGAVPMEKPIMKEGENIFDYANRMVEWTRNQNLWKTAPKQTGFQDALDKWKADNGLSPDAYPPVRPHRENYSTEIGYAEDLEEYNKKKELWKSAPKPKDFDLSVDLEDMNKQLRNIRRAVLNQKNYDQRTVKAVSDLVRKMLNIGWGDGLSRGKVGNLLSAAKNATGANDVKKYLDKAMGILADNYLNRLSTAYDNLINTKGARADQSGVIKMGSLDAKGQAFMSEYKKAINMDDSSLNTYIANIEEDSAKNEDNVEMNDYRLDGIQAAIMYKQQIGGNDADIAELKRQIGELKNKKDATKEDKDLLKSLEKKLFENKFDRINMYENLLNNIQRMVKESKGRAKEFREEIAEHKNEILHRANLDLEGVDSTYYDTTTAKKKFVNNDLQRAVFSSTYTFEQFLKFFGKHSANGEGRLYNYFHKLNQDALDEEQLYNEMNRNALDEKTKELFGKNKFMKLVGIDGKNMKEMDVEVTDYSNKETGKRTIHLKQGQMLYIYLVNKETDGEMKLRAMGITEEDVAAIEENLDPRVKAMGEWLQDEYLPECQRRYQATHTKYFGAPMKEVENYFPLAINNRARNVKEDVNQDSDAMSQLAGTSTGAIVTRRVNVIPLDIENADAFEVAFNHLQEMEEWSAMLPFRQDINTLLSYTHFRNQVQNMSSVAYGSGKTLWDEFKQTAQIAAGTYKPKVNAGMMDSRIAAAMGGIAVAKISGRLWTAIKQSQSATVFLPECDFTRFVKNGVNPYGSWKWAKENIPDFRKRIENITYGDVKLRQYLDELEKYHDWTKVISKLGMAPNILVDGITCAVGARSVYETEVNRLTKLGYPKEKADEKAYYKAVAAYNKTQQSSGGMYLSPMQVDRTYVSAALSLFKNANYAYGRMQIEACRGLARTYDFWGGKHKTTLIESMTRQIMEEDGLDENTARAIAKATYNRTFRQSIGRLINFATLVPVSWALYKVLPYLLTGDDDDKKKDMIEEAVLKGFATSLSDNYVIPFASNILNAGLKVEDGKPTFDPEVFRYQNLYINPATSDLANIYSMIGNQKWYSVANKFGMLGVQSLIGFNPETVGALYQALSEADYDNGNTAKEWQIGILKAISAPEESIRELYMDELGLKSGDKDTMKKFMSLAGFDADDINKVPLAELEKRYAERQINRDNLLSQIGMDAETFNGYVDKYQKSFEKKIKDKMDKWDEYDKKKADEFFDTTSDPKLKDMIEKKRTKDANAAADEQIAKEGLNQEKKGKEPSEEAYDAVKMSIDVAEDNAISTFNKVLNKRYAALNDEYNNQTDAMKYIFMNKHPNFKAYKDLESEYTTYGKKMKELKEKLVSADGYDAKQTILKQIRAKREKFSELQSKVR